MQPDAQPASGKGKVIPFPPEIARVLIAGADKNLRHAKTFIEKRQHTLVDNTREFRYGGEWLMRGAYEFASFDPEALHFINTEEISIFVETASMHFYKIGIDVLISAVTHGAMRISIMDEIIDDDEGWFHEYAMIFEPIFREVIAQCVVNWHATGLVFFGLRYDARLQMHVPYVPADGTYKIATTITNSKQEYVLFEKRRREDVKTNIALNMDETGSIDYRHVWIPNFNIIILDDFNVQYRPRVDGKLRSMISTTYEDQMRIMMHEEATTLADRMHARPAMFFKMNESKKAIPDADAIAARDQFGYSEQDTAYTTEDMLASYQPIAADRIAEASDIKMVNKVISQIVRSDMHALKSSMCHSFYETADSVPVHVLPSVIDDVKWGALPPHPGANSGRLVYYVAKIARAMGLPLVLFLENTTVSAVSSAHGSGGSAGSNFSRDVGMQQMAETLRRWTNYFDEVLNMLNKHVLVANGWIGKQAAHIGQAHMFNASARSVFVRKKYGFEGISISNTNIAEVLEVLMEMRNGIKVHFETLLPMKPVNMMLNLYDRGILKWDSLVSLMAAETTLPHEMFEETEQPRKAPAKMRKLENDTEKQKSASEFKY